MSKRGMLVVLSGPSGVGKGTVREQIFKQPENIFNYSVSMTTRPMREGEVNGCDYYFVSKSEFEKHIENGKMLEYAKYVNNYYGTPVKYVNETLERGKDVLLEIEVEGAFQVQEKIKDSILIFLIPPSLEELQNRIRKRGTENDEIVNQRMLKAIEELKQTARYDYAVINDDVNQSVQEINQILASERLRASRVYQDYQLKLGDFKL